MRIVVALVKWEGQAESPMPCDRSRFHLLLSCQMLECMQKLVNDNVIITISFSLPLFLMIQRRYH